MLLHNWSNQYMDDLLELRHKGEYIIRLIILMKPRVLLRSEQQRLLACIHATCYCTHNNDVTWSVSCLILSNIPIFVQNLVRANDKDTPKLLKLQINDCIGF